jgi:hypothetical protein
MPTALSRPRECRHRGGVVLACRSSSRSAPTLNPHSTRCQPVPNFPRLRALALFGRRPPQRVDSLLMPASENLHMSGSRPPRPPRQHGREARQPSRSIKTETLARTVDQLDQQYKCCGCNPGKCPDTQRMVFASRTGSRDIVHDRYLCIAV